MKATEEGSGIVEGEERAGKWRGVVEVGEG